MQEPSKDILSISIFKTRDYLDEVASGRLSKRNHLMNLMIIQEMEVAQTAVDLCLQPVDIQMIQSTVVHSSRMPKHA